MSETSRLEVFRPDHAETVVCLSNNNTKQKDYVEIGIDVEDYYRIKDGKMF